MFCLNFQTKIPSNFQSELNKIIPDLLKKKPKQKLLAITFCDNKFIQKLNKKFRGYNKPTDVLSFPLEDKELWGDIIISLPKTKENAKIYGNTWLGETLYLVIHGLCHLSGHNHSNKIETLKMRKAEEKLLKILAKQGLQIKGRI